MDTHYAHRIWYDADRLNALLSTKTDRYGGMPRSTMARKVQGFVTGQKSRNLLFQTLEAIVNEDIDILYTEELINELLTLIRKPPTNRIEAAPGEHDDMVMAYLIGIYVLLNASNLEEFGIKRWDRDMEDGPTERRKETEAEYRARVADALPIIDEKYRAIFKDFLAHRDPVRDSREYARRRHQAEQMSRQGYAGSYFGPIETGDDIDQFDAGGTIFTPVRQIDKHSGRVLTDNAQDELIEAEPEEYFSSALTNEERKSFEAQIWGLNGDGIGGGLFDDDVPEDPYAFNPGDWV